MNSLHYTSRITAGQGEYIIFDQTTRKEISAETYEKVYDILLQYTPMEIAKRQATEEYAHRYELIRKRIKQINPNFEAVFIPRTLYELIFIRQCIEEELNGKGCPFSNPNVCDETFSQKRDHRCWYLCRFNDQGDSRHAGVREIAYRLNNLIANLFPLTEQGLTYKEISSFAEKEIDYLKDHLEKSMKDESRIKGEGLAANFGWETIRAPIISMSVRNDNDAQIIRNALALECSQIARDSLFLFRGANFEADLLERLHRLSFGTSLFAGCLYDAGATAFRFMRMDWRNAFAFVIPFHEVKNSPFFVPTASTVAQWFARGEIFHASSKAWRDADLKLMRGMQGLFNESREHLRSNFSQKELLEEYLKYKAHAIQLKPYSPCHKH